jgi:hypothetical protein
MEPMRVFVERVTQEAQLSMRCGCGTCHPTATVYRDDPRYEWHEERLAEAPCCCGRFFVVAHDEQTAQVRAHAMAERVRKQRTVPSAHAFRPQTVTFAVGSGGGGGIGRPDGLPRHGRRPRPASRDTVAMPPRRRLTHLDDFQDPILVVTAHPDDIEVHCGGTLPQLVAGGRQVTCVLCTSGTRSTSTYLGVRAMAARLFLCQAPGSRQRRPGKRL